MTPFHRLNEEATNLVLEWLDAIDLLRVGITSKSLFATSSTDYLWKKHVNKLRDRYCSLPLNDSQVSLKKDNSDNKYGNYCTRLANDANSLKNSYWIECNESYRSVLTTADLCKPEWWSFRFKEAAGSMWQDICPWHRGGSASKFAFQRIGGNNCGRIQRLERFGDVLPMNGVALEWTLGWQRGSDPGLLIEGGGAGPYAAGAARTVPHSTLAQQAMLASLKKHQASLNRSTAMPVRFQRGDLRTETEAPVVLLCSSGSSCNSGSQMSNSNNISSSHSISSSSHSISSSDIGDNNCSRNSSSSKSHMSMGTLPTIPQPLLRRSHRNKQADGDASDLQSQSLRELYLSSGNCIRVRVNHVPVPTYLLATPRSSALRGCFLLESCWGVYASFDLPLRGHCALLEDSALRVTTANQWREIRSYNLTIAGPNDSDDEEDVDGVVDHHDDADEYGDAEGNGGEGEGEEVDETV